MRKRGRLFEAQQAEIDPSKIDTDAGIIPRVKILGCVSRKGRIYTTEAIKGAVKLYEGRQVNLDHPISPDAPRGFMERIGNFKNVLACPDGLYGDLHYLKSHPASGMVVECARRHVKNVGFSHNCDSDWEVSGGRVVINRITAVRSVDLCADPTSTNSFYESEAREMTRSTIEAEHGVIEDMGVTVGGEFAVEAVPETVEEAVDKVETSFASLALAILQDDSLSDDEKKTRVAALLDAKSDVVAAVTGEEESAAEEPEAPSKPTDTTPEPPGGESDESEEAGRRDKIDQILAQNRRLVRREKARAFLEAEGVMPSEPRIQAIAGVSVSAAKALAKDWKRPKRRAAGQFPMIRGGQRMTEAGSASPKLPYDPNDIKAMGDYLRQPVS